MQRRPRRSGCASACWAPAAAAAAAATAAAGAQCAAGAGCARQHHPVHVVPAEAPVCYLARAGPAHGAPECHSVLALPVVAPAAVAVALAANNCHAFVGAVAPAVNAAAAAAWWLLLLLLHPIRRRQMGTPGRKGICMRARALTHSTSSKRRRHGLSQNMSAPPRPGEAVKTAPMCQ
eukprot:534431-Pelagomonas_calceolata.AAC.2